VKIHLIGICGTGMGSLAGLLKAAGQEVRGSDENVYPPMSTQLAEQGIHVYQGFRPENLEWQPERVVVGNVCRKDHVEVLAAQARGLTLTSFPALLSELFLAERHSLVVAGTHGKTTTASLASFILHDAGRDPSFLLGGVPLDFGRGWRLGQGDAFVVEGDEYDTAFFDKGSKFLHYRPRTAILTSVELDHVDIFKDLDAVKDAFRKFVALIPADGLLVVAQSSPHALDVARAARCRVVTYGIRPEFDADYTADIINGTKNGRQLFEVRARGEGLCLFETGLVGRHNLENALGVIAALHGVGLEPAEIARGLRRFSGVKRRQEVRGVAQGVIVIDDFAHHPSAVKVTLQGIRERFGRGRLTAVFEPRSATSRRAVFQTEYAAAFADADEVVLAPLHAPEKVPAGERLDVERLCRDLRQRGTAAHLFPAVDQMVEHICNTVHPGEIVVVMSSGGFGGLHDKLLRRLGDAVEPASYTDLPHIRHLLDRVGLPYEGVAEHIRDFLVIRDPDGEGLVATVGIELYDEAALLRSLAVLPARRGQGLGWMLADAAIGRARARGARRLYLLTMSASDFFAQKCGFQTFDRNLVEQAVWASSEFSLAACAGATCMRLTLA
jgi:UDP-N-acetylmuramate: L-alanyl-gamma-D-glutamyl-meso-diaminopimelate ligase